MLKQWWENFFQTVLYNCHILENRELVYVYYERMNVLVNFVMLLNVMLLSYHNGISENPASGSFTIFYFWTNIQSAINLIVYVISVICFCYLPSSLSYFLWLVVTVQIQTNVLPLCHWFVFRRVSSPCVSVKHMNQERTSIVFYRGSCLPPLTLYRRVFELQTLGHTKTHVSFQVKPRRPYHRGPSGSAP